ncbi:hypothetical protein SBA3_530017 [Candidatus Sulfopaludibacter sp. SbA3]|nr:hypothetical protein SBA3_530017 [Candidatus Sulfopaludibacter sp. SbA3]
MKTNQQAITVKTSVSAGGGVQAVKPDV